MVDAVRRIDVGEVWCEMNNMKNGEATVSSGIVLKMLKAGE